MSEKRIKFSSGISLLKENYFPNLILNHKWIIKFKRSPTGDCTGLSHPVAAVTPEHVSTQYSMVYKSLSAAALSFGHIPKICCLKWIALFHLLFQCFGCVNIFYQLRSVTIFISCLFVLTVPYRFGDPSSLIRAWTPACGIDSTESSPLDCQGVPSFWFFLSAILPITQVLFIFKLTAEWTCFCGNRRKPWYMEKLCEIWSLGLFIHCQRNLL